MHRNSQENQLMKRQKIIKSHPALLTPHLQLQTSQDFVSIWCRCQNFLPAAIQAARGLCSPQTEEKQAVALGSRIAWMVRIAMSCYLLCLWSTRLATNNCQRGNSPSARGCSFCDGSSGRQSRQWRGKSFNCQKAGCPSAPGGGDGKLVPPSHLQAHMPSKCCPQPYGRCSQLTACP